MPSTFRHTTQHAARILLLLAMSTGVNGAPSLTYKGCFSTSGTLQNHGTYTYQTSGWCQTSVCTDGQTVMGLTNGNECYCGNALPPTSARVSDSSCDDPCDGYDSDTCGGNGFWQVYLTGISDNVPIAGGGGSSSGGGSGSGSASASGSVTSAPATTTSTQAPSVITRPGTTIVVTHQASTPTSASASASASSKNGKSGGVNTAAVAAGVVVAVVVVAIIVTALFFWLRHRKRQSAEDEYKRTTIADIMRGGERKPPATGNSNTSDSRLEPAFVDRRNSHGSIADNEDYSRKILRVANPDRNSGLPPAHLRH